jgi:predicted CXXCH cytochrome family protein
MNQLASPETVLGAFDGERVEFFGDWARPHREEDRFLMEVPNGDGSRRVAEVALCVGSRRYQQYFERVDLPGGSRLERLPLLWHIGAQRWMHLNGVFLEPDSGDWNAHRNTWNHNCVFCHTTGPQPGMQDGGQTTFETTVAELGIACEACHGPGDKHARAYRNPLLRYAAHLDIGDGEHDAELVHPGRLDAPRESAVCGQCHGQRLPAELADLQAWLVTGPSFRPGERLEEHATPVTRTTPSPRTSTPDLFSQRFWADGTPRLTAYEYQGLTGSPCFEGGEFSCGSCHSMHAGDPHGMIEEELRGDRACLQCHGEIGADIEAHTHHATGSAGSRCLECHMPRVVYGVLEIHRSHRVEVPDAARDAEAGRPHACTLCHLDRSLEWSARELDRLWGEDRGRYRSPSERLDGAPVSMPDGVASLLAGDAVQRAVYAAAGGRLDGTAWDQGFLRVHLLVSLGDAYPAVRWLAKRSLLALEERLSSGIGASLATWEHDADPLERVERLRELLDMLVQRAPASMRPAADLSAKFLVRSNLSPMMKEITALLDLQSERVISIGE